MLSPFIGFVGNGFCRAVRPNRRKANDSYLIADGNKVGPCARRFVISFKPLYRELVVQAKADGIMNAVAHHAHYGYSNHGPVRENGSEISNPQLTMCVELIGQREELELFCRRHGDLLASKVIVYKHLEHWTVGVSGVEHADATPEELAAEAE